MIEVVNSDYCHVLIPKLGMAISQVRVRLDLKGFSLRIKATVSKLTVAENLRQPASF